MMLNRSTIVLPSLLLLSFVGCAPQGEEVAPEVTVSESSPEEETTNFRLPSFILQADEFKNLNQWDAGEKCCNHSIMLSSTIYRKGKTSVRFEQRPDDRSNIGGDGNFRAEIKQPAPLARKGKTYWVGFSVYPVKIPMLTNFFQFHQKPDKDKPWGSPPFQLRLYPDKRVELIIHPGQGAKIIQLGTYKPKQWNDIAMQVKFAEDKSAFINVWLNGKKTSYSGRPLAYSDAERGKTGPYVKMGSYTGKNRPTSKIVLYIDSFKMANNNAKLQDVHP